MPVASSEFREGYGITNVFDSDLSSQWASDGFSFTLDTSYTINAIRFAPRGATGDVNGMV
ncbi:MAG: hypothetical protein ACKON8_10365 [Planctomycetota bacterium]